MHKIKTKFHFHHNTEMCIHYTNLNMLKIISIFFLVKHLKLIFSQCQLTNFSRILKILILIFKSVFDVINKNSNQSLKQNQSCFPNSHNNFFILSRNIYGVKSNCWANNQSQIKHPYSPLFWGSGLPPFQHNIILWGYLTGNTLSHIAFSVFF